MLLKCRSVGAAARAAAGDAPARSPGQKSDIWEVRMARIGRTREDDILNGTERENPVLGSPGSDVLVRATLRSIFIKTICPVLAASLAIGTVSASMPAFADPVEPRGLQY